MVNLPMNQPSTRASLVGCQSADSALMELEAAVLAAIADEDASGGVTGKGGQALANYVAYLRVNQAPPETMLICVKKLLERSALARRPPVAAQAHHADVISRCIAAYYASPQTATD